MSKMLEQAVVDAEALKEAAMKSAEAMVLEKYSNEIKNTMFNLLEDMEDEEHEESDVADQVPLASEDDTAAKAKEAVAQARDAVDSAAETVSEIGDLLADPAIVDQIDDDQEVEVDLDDLKKHTDHPDNEPAESMLEGDEELSEDELIALVQEVANELLEGSDVEEEDEESEEETPLEEELNIDVDPQYASGNIGSNPTEYREKVDQTLASERDEETKEENKAIRDTVKQVQGQLAESRGTLKKYKKAFGQLKERLKEMTLMNAKLLYKNSVLSNTSLNGKQVKRMSEALDRTNTVEEVKHLYEALQSAVESGSSNRAKRPQSLREAVSRNSSSTILPAKNKEQLNEELNPLGKSADRMLVLAGLKSRFND